MNSADIDKIFNAIKRGFYKVLWTYADMDVAYSKKRWDEHKDEVYTNIMQKIEQGDLEYFLDKSYNEPRYFNEPNSDEDILTLLLLHSSNTEICKKLLEYSHLSGKNQIQLIKKINDIEYTKELLNKISRYGDNQIHPYIAELFGLIQDKDFTKDFIKKSKNLGKYETGFRLHSFDAAKILLSIQDPNFAKECIEERDELKLDSNDMFYLLEHCNDKEFIKECIRNGTYQGDSSISALTSVVGEPDFTKECIENRERFYLWGDALAELILQVGDPEYIKKMIPKLEKEGCFCDYVSLINGTNDPQYIRSCIAENEGFSLSLFDKIILMPEDVKFKYICTTPKGNVLFLDTITNFSEYKYACDIEKSEKTLTGFKFSDLFAKKRELPSYNHDGRLKSDFLERLKALNGLQELSEKLYKTDFSIPYIYGAELVKTHAIDQLAKNGDFRFFKSEFPTICETLSSFPKEESLDFFKFANSLGCFSTEKVLDKQGKETQVLLAQKASSLMAQLLKTDNMRLR